MKILIQHCSTLEFYMGDHQWTQDPHQAYDFQNSARALEFCQQEQMADVQIVMKFDQDKYNLNLSLTPGGEPCQPSLGD